MVTYVNALVGGMFIGVAAIMLLAFNGRILGVSGIVGGILKRKPEPWRVLFLLGVLGGGVLLLFLKPSAFDFSLPRSTTAIVIAGVLVGLGTRVGGGCTSGHGICGVSRLSLRSIVAMLVFMFFGALTVLVVNHLWGGRV